MPESLTSTWILSYQNRIPGWVELKNDLLFIRETFGLRGRSSLKINLILESGITNSSERAAKIFNLEIKCQ